MRIASFTMVGQFPHGIDLHVRNLQWALSSDDHIYIVTLPEHIQQFNLENKVNVTFIPFPYQGVFVPFWDHFPKILEKLAIKPEWFLFMEQDIWFSHSVVAVPKNKKEIVNYLPLQKHYHSILVSGEMIHPRVWEGANLIHCDIIHRAIEQQISFSFTKKFFCQDWPEIALNDWNNTPDTFDELGLYCALQEKTKAVHESFAVHLRGPESLHRCFPDLYYQATEQQLCVAQKKLNYICVYAAVAVYYLAGNWTEPLHWHKMKATYKKEYKQLCATVEQWMKEGEWRRFKDVVQELGITL
jgi:hypothetical protein